MGERFIFFWLAMVEVGPMGPMAPIGSGAGTPKEEA